MAVTALSILKTWYQTGKKPTEAQFWNWMDSYWHKQDIIPQSSIQDLETTLDAKAEMEALQSHINDEAAHAGNGGGVQLGETETTAHRGDQGKTAYDHSQDASVHVSTSQKTNWNNKINAAAANPSLAAANTRVGLLMPDGTITYNSNLYYDPQTRTLVVGTTGNAGRLDVASTVFKLKVQSNIATGNATIEFNAGQDDALSFVDTTGKKYLTLKSTLGGQGLISIQDLILDQGIFYPVKQKQGALTSNGAGVKGHAKDSIGIDLELIFATDTMAGIFEVAFLLKSSTATTTIAGKFKAVVKRVAGTITVTPVATEFITNAANPAILGIDAVGNNTLKFYFTQNAADTASVGAYTGAITEIKYSIN